VAAKALPDLQQVQKLLAQRFPEPLATGIDPRAANIALLESRYEYERWIRALYKVHEEAGLKFEGVDPLATMLKTNSIFVKGIFSVCLEGMDAESIRRRLAFSVGYQYMEQMTDNKGPDALRTGFGNLAEVMMFREPTMTVQSGYNPRNLNLQGPRWADMVRQRFAQNKVESLGQALNYSTRSMTLEEYADAWSLAEFLASEPRNMAELSTALEQGTDVAEALKKVYGLDDAGLMKHWRQFVLGKRQ
jgi:hypothetical protein